MPYILALDQGTSSSRTLIFDENFQMVAAATKEFRQIYPQPGWVEHDPEEIWSSQLASIKEALAKAGIEPGDILGIGIANQRETTIVWDRSTGKPIYNAIVWQDRRTASFCKELEIKHGQLITHKTGLIVDSYFSASKVAWLLDNIEGARALADAGKLAFGTVDSWLIWKLCRGKVHASDFSNASRTMLFNINTLSFDDELLEIFAIPRSLLPDVIPSQGVFGETDLLGPQIALAGIAGDQQSALFGQLCFKPGTSKTTYGTGCFTLFNTGNERPTSTNKLLSTLAWQIDGKTTYALEGSVFIGGAAVSWLRDGLQLIDSSPEVEALAASVESAEGVVFVPAFNGLGTPYWDQDARGTILGLTRGSTKAHLARATLEAIAFQVVDLIQALQADAGLFIESLRVDGGAATNNLLMQIQADLLGVPVVRPKNIESTASGAAMLAGLAVGLYPDLDYLLACDELDRIFEPKLAPEVVADKKSLWSRAIERAKAWECS